MKNTSLFAAMICVPLIFCGISGCASGDAASVKLPEEPFVSEISVEAVPGIPSDFIRGMDISSVIAEEKSGVVYSDSDGKKKDIFRILAEAGINTIRVRVWNDPYDEEGNGYGGGNCDVANAAEVGKRAAAAGMSLLVDFHYSDFWADPAKQMAPKAWEGMSADEKADAAYEYTKEALGDIMKAGANVSMVQIGNEINYGMSGETEEKEIIKILRRASEAVRETAEKNGKDVRIAVHFTNIDDPKLIARKAKWLKDEKLDYDVFGVSYYPFWHGSIDNMKKVLAQTKTDTGKDVMVLETSFPYTTDDGDGTANSAGDTHELGYYYVSRQGQAQAVHDVIAGAVEAGAVGVCYWEGAWVPVPGSASEKKALWESRGSGWASSYAAGYDPEDAGKYYGGSSWDNQAFFDHSGKRMSSLDVFNGVVTGTISDADPMNGYCKDPSVKAPAEAESLLLNPGFEDEDISMWEVKYQGGSDPTDRQTKEADAKSGENAFHFWSANEVDFDVSQTVTADEKGKYTASASLQGGDVGNDADIHMYVLVNGSEAGTDPVQLNGWVNWKEPVIEFEAEKGDSITVGFVVKCAPGGWGTIDDVVLKLSGQ